MIETQFSAMGMIPNITGRKPMSRQYLACKFKVEAETEYTYHNDGPPAKVGDSVLIKGRGESSKALTVIVTRLVPDKPPFPTNPILGIAPPEKSMEPEPVA